MTKEPSATKLVASDGCVLTDGTVRTHVAYVPTSQVGRWREVPEGEGGEPAPTGPTALGNYAAGTLFELDGTLYRANVAIARGEEVSGANATELAVADVLNAIESEE